MNRKLKVIESSVIGAISTIVFIALVTVGAEIYLPLQDWLKVTFSHHWIGKSLLACGVFAAAFAFSMIFFGDPTPEKISKKIDLLTYLTVFTSAVIIGFFLQELFLHF